jgi:hypothetical protein
VTPRATADGLGAERELFDFPRPIVPPFPADLCTARLQPLRQACRLPGIQNYAGVVVPLGGRRAGLWLALALCSLVILDVVALATGLGG